MQVALVVAQLHVVENTRTHLKRSRREVQVNILTKLLYHLIHLLNWQLFCSSQANFVVERSFIFAAPLSR